MTAIARHKPELLPISYRDAKQALAKCDRVDECKDWGDKALALKSYAKQMNDTSLEGLAQRIRDRAIRRGGELLLQLKEARGANQNFSAGARTKVATRKDAAKAAGLSAKQAVQMLRVARVPKEQFENLVDADKPATVTQLAEIGTEKSDRVRPEPYRNEWCDWTNAVHHLAALPACGLAVLAVRCPLELPELRQRCAAAITNLRLWQQELESCHVGTRQDVEPNDGQVPRPHQSSAA
jgi:hypothetical protein